MERGADGFCSTKQVSMLLRLAALCCVVPGAHTFALCVRVGEMGGCLVVSQSALRALSFACFDGAVLRRWRFAGGAAVCCTGFFVYRALRGLPLRQILMLVAKMQDSVPEQVETALNSGEGTRLIQVSRAREHARCCCVLVPLAFGVW